MRARQLDLDWLRSCNMNLEEQLQLHKEIDELSDRRLEAAKAQDYKTAHELALKMIGRYETLVDRLES